MEDVNTFNKEEFELHMKFMKDPRSMMKNMNFKE